MGDSQGGERILPLENELKLCLSEVSNYRKEFPAGTPGPGRQNEPSGARMATEGDPKIARSTGSAIY